MVEVREYVGKSSKVGEFVIPTVLSFLLSNQEDSQVCGVLVLYIETR